MRPRKYTGCSEEGCNEEHYAKELCDYHYRKSRSKLPQTLEYQNNYQKEYRKIHPKVKSLVNEYMNRIKNKKFKEREYRSVNEYYEKLGSKFNMTDNQYVCALDLWAIDIKTLDNYMCKNCDTIENLNAHHIVPKKDFPELSFDLDNGVTLCDNCHPY